MATPCVLQQHGDGREEVQEQELVESSRSFTIGDAQVAACTDLAVASGGSRLLIS